MNINYSLKKNQAIVLHEKGREDTKCSIFSDQIDVRKNLSTPFLTSKEESIHIFFEILPGVYLLIFDDTFFSLTSHIYPMID